MDVERLLPQVLSAVQGALFAAFPHHVTALMALFALLNALAPAALRWARAPASAGHGSSLSVTTQWSCYQYTVLCSSLTRLRNAAAADAAPSAVRLMRRSHHLELMGHALDEASPQPGHAEAYGFRGETVYIQSHSTQGEHGRRVQSLELSTRECGRGQLLADMVRELADAHRALRRERPMVHEVVGGVWREVAPVRARAVDDICMDADRRQRFKDDVRTFLDSEAFYLQAGVAWTRGYLLHGPPGGGKTSLVQAVMSGYQLPGYLLALSSVATDEALTGLFRCLPSTPHVLVLEDVDCVGCALERREPREAPPVEAAEPAAAGPASPKPKPGVTLAGLLNAINGVLCSHGRLLFLTTNHRERLDAALVRAGRCDVHLEMGPVGAAQLRQLYERFFGEPPRKLAAALEAAWSDGLMPATVSATFLAHRDDGPAALRALASQRPLQV